MIPLLVPEIEGGYPERDGGEGAEGAEGEEEGLVLEYSSSWMINSLALPSYFLPAVTFIILRLDNFCVFDDFDISDFVCAELCRLCQNCEILHFGVFLVSA